jgi:hypothetical protein
MGSGGDYGGIVIALSILFVIGFIVPLCISPFVESGEYNQNSIAVPFIDFIENGVGMDWVPIVPDFSINIFGIFGDGFQNFMVSQLEAFSYIPNIVAIPLLLFSFILFVYSIIKLIP